MWDGLLDFDRLCEETGKPPLRADEGVFAKLVEALPEVDYVDGNFAGGFGEPDLADELRVPLSAG